MLWPCACELCGVADRQLCEPCIEGMRAAGQRPLWVTLPSGYTVCAAGRYEGDLRTLLIAYKHAGRTGCSKVLAAQLVIPLREVLRQARSTQPVIVTIPSRPERVRERGYRHVDVLVRRALRCYQRAERRCSPASGVLSPGSSYRASVLARQPRPLLLSGALRTRTGRRGQVGLNSRERAQNAALLRVPTRFRRALQGREVLLVDDIVTTGATVAAAAAVLHAAGAQLLSIVALAATPRRDSAPQHDAALQHDAVVFEAGVKVRPEKRSHPPEPTRRSQWM